MGDPLRAGKPSPYVTSHIGQLIRPSLLFIISIILFVYIHTFTKFHSSENLALKKRTRGSLLICFTVISLNCTNFGKLILSKITTISTARPHTPLGKFAERSRPLTGFKGPTSKGKGDEGRVGVNERKGPPSQFDTPRQNVPASPGPTSVGKLNVRTPTAFDAGNRHH